MGHYKSNLRDIEFNLFELFDISKVFQPTNYEGMDEIAARQILAEVARFTENEIAEQFMETDRKPPEFIREENRVKIPAGFKQIVGLVRDSGWQNLGLTEEIGGIPAPKPLAWAVTEMFLGAQPAAYFYMAGAPFSSILFNLGTAEQKQWAKTIFARKWGATMVLTEPDAGSDVGAATTKAIKQADGSWHIEGVKRFITSGDADDIFENLFHLVLARPEGAPGGTKGLSLFFVPKFLFDFTTGEMGERNGVFATNLEHKMGLKASATCELTFGLQGIPAKGWLVGEEHNGIAQMFQVIEYSRMIVGTKAIATLSTGYLNALEYAKTRIQGKNILAFADKNTAKVAIIEHPDVRRSLLSQKTYAEGLRAIYLLTACFQEADLAEAMFGIDAELAGKVNDLLLPVVKGVGSERAYEKLTETLQTFGGSGYLQDYPIEQYIRDAKIDSLYEGTTAIQAQDFIFRKIIKDQGVALNFILREMQKFASGCTNPELRDSIVILTKSIGVVKQMFDQLNQYLYKTGEDATNLQKIGLVSVKVLLSFGDLLIGYLLLWQAKVALEKMSVAKTKDKLFYEGKIGGAIFFAQNILPLLESQLNIVANIDTSIMSLNPEAL